MYANATFGQLEVCRYIPYSLLGITAAASCPGAHLRLTSSRTTLRDMSPSPLADPPSYCHRPSTPYRRLEVERDLLSCWLTPMKLAHATPSCYAEPYILDQNIGAPRLSSPFTFSGRIPSAYEYQIFTTWE
jgi:hypothetical protein